MAVAQKAHENPTAEQFYWRKVHREQQERENSQEKRYQELRQQTQATLPDLVEQGAAVQKQVLLESDGLPAAVVSPPSVLASNGDHILLVTLAALVAALLAKTVVRYRREAEIRVLAGNYLADGREAVTMRMPELFASPFPEPLRSPPGGDGDVVVPAEKQLMQNAEFFAKASERLGTVRRLLSDFGKAFDDVERQKVLFDIRELVSGIKMDAGCWDLRPAWQMSSALELLLERLLSKGKELTPSTLRTVASAVDVLAEVCVPGIRPDLIITPQISVLAVDDDALCLRAVVFALEKAGLTPDVATDGEKAVSSSLEKSYDVIFMDIQMPGIDGLAAANKIRAGNKNEDTPIIFVTVRSDFQTRAESSRIGGTDFIAKPFLQFEITVKALTFAMRKRLQLAASLQRAVGPATLLASEKAVSKQPELAAAAA